MTLSGISQVKEDDQRDHIELCPDAGVIVQDIAERIKVDGGFSLIADYGHVGDKGHSFRVSLVYFLSLPYNVTDSFVPLSSVRLSVIMSCLSLFRSLALLTSQLMWISHI